MLQMLAQADVSTAGMPWWAVVVISLTSGSSVFGLFITFYFQHRQKRDEAAKETARAKDAERAAAIAADASEKERLWKFINEQREEIGALKERIRQLESVEDKLAEVTRNGLAWKKAHDEIKARYDALQEKYEALLNEQKA